MSTTGDRIIEDRIVDAVKSAARNGRLACKEALGLAAALGVAPAVVGRAADILGVKITGCQLGCF